MTPYIPLESHAELEVFLANPFKFSTEVGRGVPEGEGGLEAETEVDGDGDGGDGEEEDRDT